MVDDRFPGDSRGPDAFKYALEHYLRALPKLAVALDGFTFLNVVAETPTELRVVGLSHVLPSSELPIDASFRRVGCAIEYRILVGLHDRVWADLTGSKRWKAVYLYATEALEPKWSWDQPVEGLLTD